MNFSINRDQLLEPLQTVVGVIARQHAMPILSNIMLSLKNQELTLTATDTEIDLISSAPIETPSDDCATTISGRKLFDICRVLPANSTIHFEQQDNERIMLRTERDKFILACLPTDNFPNTEWQQEKQLTEFTIIEAELHKLLDSTFFAMAKQDVRYYLNGLTLEAKDNTLWAIASDGHRLASNIATTVTNSTQVTKVIAPYKGTLELLRLLSDSNNELKVTIGNSHLRVMAPNFTFTSKLVDSKAPNYEKAIPRDGKLTAIVNSVELRQALQRVAILAHEISREVELNFSNNLLCLKTQTQIQQAEEEIPIEFEGDNITINFNINYILDIFNHSDAEKTTITFKDAISSVLFEHISPQSNSLYVVMPLRS